MIAINRAVVFSITFAILSLVAVSYKKLITSQGSTYKVNAINNCDNEVIINNDISRKNLNDMLKVTASVASVMSVFSIASSAQAYGKFLKTSCI